MTTAFAGHSGCRRGFRTAIMLLTLLAGSGCDGENLFQTMPSGAGGRTDASAPVVQIQTPTPRQRSSVQDSLLVRVSVRDQQGLRAVELRGFAIRGSAALGTQTRVERFVPKKVQFDSAATVRDTTVLRYLQATPDTLPDDSVLIVVAAEDRAGNVRADTVSIALGGPRVQLLSPVNGAQVRAGSMLRVRIAASSPGDRVQSLTLRVDSAFARDTTLSFDAATAAVDTVVTLTIPSNAAGSMRLRAIARTLTNDSAASMPVINSLLPAARDASPPAVSFRVSAPTRAERTDSVAVTVVATDSVQVAQVGVSLRPIHRLASRTDTLRVLSLFSSGDSATFRFTLAQLGLPEAADTSTVRLEVTAFARDGAGNCAAATVPATALSEPCDTTSGRTFAQRSGARYHVMVLMGRTLALRNGTDLIADIASDGSRVFLSNLTGNRLDVFQVGADRITQSVSVGSRPWGMALGPDRQTLYVANSGGTNISVVSIAALAETRRIQTPNVKLYDVSFSAQRIANPATTDTLRRDSITAFYPSTVARYDYSDRPQFIGVTRNQNLIYSTAPTAAAPDGTLRILHAAQERLEIITEYAEERVEGKVVISNADSALLVVAKPFNLIQVCPRPRSQNPARDRTLPKRCFVGHLGQVQDSIDAYGYDTKFHYNLDIAEVGLSDTTFVAVSGDHGTIAFGEGARSNGRIMVVEDRAADASSGPLVKFGEIRDIVGNTAERIIGLSLNRTGSLGVARGSEAFYFDRDLRLQGTADTGSKAGGVDMHPDNTGSGVSYVSGVTRDGLAYIDVIDTFTFRTRSRIFVRDPITGPLRAVATADGVRVYGVTARGVVEINMP